MSDPFKWHIEKQSNGLLIWTPGKGEIMSDEPFFEHKCIASTCEVILLNDDEPWCHLHSPNKLGASLPGYSARRAAEQFAELEKRANVEHRNVFDE